MNPRPHRHFRGRTPPWPWSALEAWPPGVAADAQTQDWPTAPGRRRNWVPSLGLLEGSLWRLTYLLSSPVTSPLAKWGKWLPRRSQNWGRVGMGWRKKLSSNSGKGRVGPLSATSSARPSVGVRRDWEGGALGEKKLGKWGEESLAGDTTVRGRAGGGGAQRAVRGRGWGQRGRGWTVENASPPAWPPTAKAEHCELEHFAVNFPLLKKH